MLVLDVIHQDFPGQRWPELRFSSTMTVEELKNRLYRHTGTPPEHMKIYAFYPGKEAEGVAVFPDSSSLQDVGVRNQMTLQVVDTAHKAKELLLPAMGAFSNERQSKIQWLNEESYDKRPDTMRQFLRKLKSQKQATATPESASGAEPNVCTLRGPSEIQTAAAPQTLSVGQRCEVLALGGVRGEIVFIGKRQQKDGQWVGILLDEPLGVDGVPHCPSRYGYFVKYKDFASKVLIGDYPPVDLTELVAS